MSRDTGYGGRGAASYGGEAESVVHRVSRFLALSEVAKRGLRGYTDVGYGELPAFVVW